MTETAITECGADHNTPAGGENGTGITIEDNQDKDCFSIRSDNHDGSEDLIHFCDWPALKAAIDKHQAERGGRLTETAARTFYLLACLECGSPERPLPMPFGDQAERGKWASEHTRGTGHDLWLVWEETV
jgi:hypothetical protein